SDALTAAEVGFVELVPAFDGIAVVVNPQNGWADCLTVEQLARIWRPDDPAERWSDVDPQWPDEPIQLYGPGADSGTFEYFTEVIVGEAKSCRSDFSASEDDNVLVTGVSNDKHALGYFGFAYYDENREKLKVLSIREGDGQCVAPEVETIRNNTYRPLSRPLYLYVRHSLLARPEGSDFVRFYLDQSATLATEVGYVPVSSDMRRRNDERLEAALLTAGADEAEASI
ncbi:MAG: substrate-binding domain-containing protein, partial [Myxococcota bacterium]